MTNAVTGAPFLGPTISTTITAPIGHQLSLMHIGSAAMTGVPGASSCWASIAYDGTG
jgi:hypothetical protein